MTRDCCMRKAESSNVPQESHVIRVIHVLLRQSDVDRSVPGSCLPDSVCG